MTSTSTLNDVEALNRAQVLYDAGRHAEAETVLLDTLATGAATTTVYRLLARVECALNNPAREELALQQALVTTPAKAESGETMQLWARLGAVRAWQGDSAGALSAYESAARINPGDLGAQQGMARARLALEDLEGARRIAEELDHRFPEAAFTHLFAGHVHKAFGDSTAAGKCYLRALELEPTLGEALYNLVDLPETTSGADIPSRAADLSSRDDLAVEDRINANFAYARILDSEGRYAEAFERFRYANDLVRNEMVRRGIDYVPSRVESRVVDTMADYPTSSFSSVLPSLPIDLVPIFIVGLPRSGTTLIEQILASHREVQAAGEVVFARECEHDFRQRRAAAGRTGAVDPADPVDMELLETVREQYVENLFERGLDGHWIVDKLPANFEIVGFLRLMFPQSPIIHCVRDPRAACFSLYCANFAAHEPWYNDLESLAHYHGQYRRLMTHWRKVIPAPFVDVVYEQLVRDPHSRIPALLQAIGLSFDSSCLEFHRLQRPILTASHAQVRRPIYTSALDHWRRYAEWLGPLRDLSID